MFLQLLPGYCYHVTHRGNRRSRIFFESDDRDVYCAIPYTGVTPANRTEYSPGHRVTFQDRWLYGAKTTYLEDFCMGTQEKWSNDTHDEQDWANPGYQWGIERKQ
jgi:hypothetical protein